MMNRLPSSPPKGAHGVSLAPAVLLEEDALETHFQPIVSLRGGAVFAFEGLARGVEARGGRLIPPATLFGVADELELAFEFDSFCLRRALASFAAREGDGTSAISLNWDSRTLARYGEDPELLMKLADAAGISRSRIILEVVESEVHDLGALERFVTRHKREGFLVAIDDYGTGHSTPERLARIEPDIIKIDRALTHGLSSSTPRLEACRAVTQLARSLGALVIAEGIEEDEDVVAAAMLGIDLFQGFAFARPHPSPASAAAYALEGLARVLPSVREMSASTTRMKREMRGRHEALVDTLAARLERTPRAKWGVELEAWVSAHEELEALYVLDREGIQISETITAEESPKGLFRAAEKGADQSLKDYFLELSEEYPTFTSTPYLSMATGRRCVTHSRLVRADWGELLVLCCDLRASAHAYPSG